MTPFFWVPACTMLSMRPLERWDSLKIYIQSLTLACAMHRKVRLSPRQAAVTILAILGGASRVRAGLKPVKMG